LHADRDTICTMIANVRNALQHLKSTAEQLAGIDPWNTLVRYIVAKVLTANARKKRLRLPLAEG